ncbi:MAG: selenocysteine-specific translation elongation factor [Acidimicrobiales bacterium]
MHVVATAGHVDHGKSTLVLSLTGTDPDRFAEEKARGLTIDLGFAHCRLESGREIAFVDVPGHVRFLKNMLAGVGMVDACLFVVAATEGWKPQSEEHLRILELLGLRHGVVALTKVGLVDDELRELARLDVEEHVEGTFLADADIVEVDSLSGEGRAELLAALDALTAAAPTAADLDRPRLWVDRAFAARGAGTVVTGTLVGGALAVDDELLLCPRGKRVRVRSLQSLHQPQPRVGPGNRTAVNLTGAAREEIERGDALVTPGRWQLTQRIDASLTVLASLDHDVSRRGAHVAYLGSGEHPVKLRVLGREAIPPGASGFVRLHLPHPLPLLPGDRFVLREFGRAETVGGGEVLDVDPVRPASKARPDRSVERVVAERGWVRAEVLERLTGQRRAPDAGPYVVDPDAWAAAKTRLRARVEQAGPLGLDVAALDERERLALAALDDVTVDAGRATLGEAADPLASHPFVAALEAAPFAPPGAEGVDKAELRELARRRLVVQQDGVFFAPAALDAAARKVAELLAVQPAGVTVAEVRDALGSTRKHVLPLLALLDAGGMTRRRGDARIAGPRLPEVEPR